MARDQYDLEPWFDRSYDYFNIHELIYSNKT